MIRGALFLIAIAVFTGAGLLGYGPLARSIGPKLEIHVTCNGAPSPGGSLFIVNTDRDAGINASGVATVPVGGLAAGRYLIVFRPPRDPQPTEVQVPGRATVDNC